MIVLDVASSVLLVAGCLFFTAGTLGVLRFGDLLSRLHALTKADNVGLALLLLGLMLRADSLGAAAKLGFVWVFAVVSSAMAARLLAEHVGQDEHVSAGEPG